MIDMIPAGWTKWTMSDVMAEFYDGPHATPPASELGAVYLGIKNITNDGHLDLSQVRHIAEADYATWTKRVEPCAGDLVFTYEATLHRYAVLPPGFRGTLGRRIALIRPRRDRVETRYLHYVFLSPQWRRTIEQHMNIGSTVDRIPLIDFPQYPIVLPPLEYQREVVRVLGAIDDLIENDRRRIEILEQMSRLLYREWFVHFRYPGHEDAELVDSDLGPIPRGWKARRLGDIVELSYGKALRAGDRRGGPVAVYGSGGQVGWHDKALVTGPGIVVGRKGNVGSVYWSDRDFFPIDTTYYAESALPLRFLDQLLRTLKFVDSHAAVPGLSRDQAYGLVVAEPDGELLSQYETAVRPMYGLRQVLSDQTAVLRDARDLLLPRLVAGELDMSELGLEPEAVGV